MHPVLSHLVPHSVEGCFGGHVAALLHSNWVTREPFLAQVVQFHFVAYLIPFLASEGQCTDQGLPRLRGPSPQTGGQVVWAADVHGRKGGWAHPMVPRRRSLGHRL